MCEWTDGPCYDFRVCLIRPYLSPCLQEKPRDVSIKTYGKATFDDEEFFYQLLELDRKEAVMGAGSKSGSSRGARIVYLHTRTC